MYFLTRKEKETKWSVNELVSRPQTLTGKKISTFDTCLHIYISSLYVERNIQEINVSQSQGTHSFLRGKQIILP